MAMYYYASKISAIACGTRCRQTVLQKSRGQRDRDKSGRSADDDNNVGGRSGVGDNGADRDDDIGVGVGGDIGIDGDTGMAIYTTSAENALAEAMAAAAAAGTTTTNGDGVRYRRRHSEQLDAYDLELGFQKLEVSLAKSTKTTFTGYGIGSANMDGDIVQYDIPKNSYKRANSDINYEEFIFSFLLSSRLFLRPHELLGKLLSSVPDSESLESLVALLAEWTHKFPYDYRDERMMGHVKHIVARCSNTNLEGVVSEILSALLKQLTDLERHEEDLRACQSTNEKSELSKLDCPTASQYAQILCRLEKKLAKQIGPEEFLQCSSNVLLDKQKKWDQPSTSGGPPGVQDPKKTCNLETYLDWSARLRLFVCNEILQCIGIRDRSKTVELWSGVAQYCLLVGNYNSATAILESLESPPVARLKITRNTGSSSNHLSGIHGSEAHLSGRILNGGVYLERTQPQSRFPTTFALSLHLH
ncbi:ras-GEF domain-containing family member 1C-like [Rhagoletis pomonella]|uniref:ras-GEF domain-containing family member 1C-like n=1 Tax=Rhagoletis pomonella TaxID=28610 RepID=UPI001780BAF4|nr:ras-GEF domain-containing family member 1C-like [Rhagoletis pomonella]